MRTTKSIILTFVLLTSTLFSSCSSDDENTSEEPSIVGTWLSVFEVSEEFLNNVSQGTTRRDFDEDDFLTLTFNTDNTFSSFFSEPIPGGSLETSTEIGTYTMVGNILTLTFTERVNNGDDQRVFNLPFTLDNDNLVLVFEDIFNDSIRFEETITYSRQ